MRAGATDQGVVAGGRFARAVAPTTQLEFTSGEGAELIAAEGRRYLDFISGYAVTNTGHCHPRVVAAVREQVGSLIHVSTVGRTAPAVAYAERLCALAPMADAKVFFTNSGTEAVEAALKLARYATRRPNLVCFGGGFHGRTYGSLSVTTSNAAFRQGHEPLLPGVHVVPYPRQALRPTMDALKRLFAEQSRPDRIAAFIVEPILGEGGYAVPPDDFLPAIRGLADEHGILLIVDEVQSGFGRTGRLFACEHVGVSPDLMTVGKGIASGLPMGALLGAARVMDAWPPGAHGNTFGGGPLVCAAASATLDVLLEEGLVGNAAARGRQLLAGVREKAAAHPGVIADVRGRGLMVGIESTAPAAAAELKTALLERGIIVSTCGPESGVVRLAPPLIVAEAQVDRFLGVFDRALTALAG
ncbi:MAG: aspartate aminotransferase family protein [Candidatus Dormibacteraeota bacterium]|nr:aspartate aminotransferase family protein [Candidatus Dormibacteraeota bacterium]